VDDAEEDASGESPAAWAPSIGKGALRRRGLVVLRRLILGSSRVIVFGSPVFSAPRVRFLLGAGA
jgi:hypothetical protein